MTVSYTHLDVYKRQPRSEYPPDGSHQEQFQGFIGVFVRIGSQKVMQGVTDALYALSLIHILTILALTTRLTCVLGFLVSILADGFTVGNLRCANVSFDLKLAEQTVHDDFQVELAQMCIRDRVSFLFSALV